MSETEKKQKRLPPKAWKPGQSGNLNGRPPKGHSITETMKEMLGADPKIKVRLSQRVLQMAERGDIAAMKLVWQYMDGMPSQHIDLDGKMATENVHIYRPEKLVEGEGSRLLDTATVFSMEASEISPDSLQLEE